MSLPVSWDDLGMALTADPAAWSHYFDRRSGEVHMVPVDPVDDDTWPSSDDIDAGLDAGDLIPIEPVRSSLEYGWMAAFAPSVAHDRLRDRLQVALDGPGAFRRFKNVLLDASAERERWFAFRDERLHEEVRQWLVDHGIDATPRSGPGA